ncbi:STAS domain-containing protein [Streptomyces sp. NPDC059866]|uniref:STAS domain-containing protein n=1 Tax=Streptomyces sp. NPDC059866 TaxID=3346978 RepID=UPI00366118D5
MPDASPTEEFHRDHGLRRVGNRLLHPFRRQEHQVGESAPGHIVVRLSGEITSENAARIGAQLQDVLRSHPDVLELDLRRLSHLSSDGGTAFFMTVRAARAHSTRVIVTHTGHQSRGVLHQLGLGRVLEVYGEDGSEAP